MRQEINLNTIAISFGLDRVEYEPEQFSDHGPYSHTALGTIPDHASSIEVSSEVQSEYPEESEHEQDDDDDYDNTDDPDPSRPVASQIKSHA